MAGQLKIDQKQNLYNELKKLHDKCGDKYDINLVREFPETFGKYWNNNRFQCAAFFVTIYLAMLDLEENKWEYPNSSGKTMVLKSCKAVILGNKSPEEAAKMFSKKKNVEVKDYVDLEDSPYAKYNGYNDFNDDAIDEAFDGFPEATWNVD